MSEPSATGRLVVETDPGVEVAVHNHNFEEVGRGTDRWSGELPVGLYSIRFRAGGQVSEDLVHLPAEGRTVRGSVVGWQSAVSSVATATAESEVVLAHREASQGSTALRRWTEAVEAGRKKGARSMLFVFVSAPVVASTSDVAQSVEAAPFTIDATPIDWDHIDHDEKEGWSARLVYDPPAQVRLRTFNGRIPIEQTLPTIDRYCTAAFLEHGRPFEKGWGILSGATRIVASRLASDPAASAEHHRYADLALRALERGGRPISENSGKQLCVDPDVDPLSRLYITAHLFARWSVKWSDSPQWIRDLALQALEKLCRDAPQIPDVRLLDAWASSKGWKQSPERPIDYPPMLDFAWIKGIQASVHRPSLVPADAPAARAGKRRIGAGPWMAWRQRPDIMAGGDTSPASPVTKRDVLALYEAAVQIVRQADLGVLGPLLKVGLPLIESSLERAIKKKFTADEINLISVLGHHDLPEATPGPGGKDDLEAAVEQTTMITGQSANTLSESLTGLVAKLK